MMRALVVAPLLLALAGVPGGAPEARPDWYETDAGASLVVPAPGLLANDPGSAAGGWRADLDLPPVSGTVSVGADGSFTYTPDTGWSGIDTFAYTVGDGARVSEPAVVTVAVNGVPLAEPDRTVTLEDRGVEEAAPGVLANDADAEHDALTAELVSPAAHGTVVLRPDGSYHYQPVADFWGSDRFAYRARDGRAAGPPAIVTVGVLPVGDSPVAGGDEAATRSGGALAVPAPGVLGNDVDADGDPLEAFLVGEPAHGTVTLARDGGYRYEPVAGYVGADSFAYVADDGSRRSAPTRVALAVGPGSLPPVLVGDRYEAVEDRPLTVPAPGVLGNDVDADGDPLEAFLVAEPAHGTVTLARDGGYRYEPVADYAGPDSFTYRAGDGAPAVVTIVVAPVNDPPRPGPLAVTVATDRRAGVTVEVVAAGHDREGGLALVDHGPATHGTVVCGAAACSYVPHDGYVGADSFAYTVRDGDGAEARGVVAVTVLPAAAVTSHLLGPVPDAARAGRPPPVLPATGAPTGRLVLPALALLAAGAVVLALARAGRTGPGREQHGEGASRGVTAAGQIRDHRPAGGRP